MKLIVTETQYKNLVREARYKRPLYTPRPEEDSFEANISPNTRIHYSPDPNLEFKNTPQKGVDFKPSGLWYGFGDNWQEFINSQDQDSHLKAKMGKNLYAIEIDPSQVLYIDNLEDIHTLDVMYGEDVNSVPKIDWSKVAMDYAGIEIKNALKLSRKVSSMLWLSTWMLDSGCVWDSSGIKSLTKLT